MTDLDEATAMVILSAALPRLFDDTKDVLVSKEYSYSKKRYDNLKSQGLCVTCSCEADKGSPRCRTCKERANAKSKQIRTDKRLIGMCCSGGCKNKARQTQIYCSPCAIKRSQLARKRRIKSNRTLGTKRDKLS